ncbi:MAG: DUF2066 domain-containing protein [Hyphomicrobiaceae bacterium]
MRDGRVLGIGVAITALALAVILPAAALAQSSIVYQVSNYPVSAVAVDAVTAKDKALEEGKRDAFRYLLKRLVDVTAYRKLPKLPAKSVEDMLSDVSVSDEQNSATEYIATLEYHFRPDSVRQFLMASGLPYTDEQSGAIAVVAKYLGPEDGSDGQAVWRSAWAGLDLAHALTPIKLTRPGASSTDDVFRALAKGQSRALGIVEAEADADRVVVALAEPVEDGNKLKVSLIGRDRVGPISLVRVYTIQDGDLGYTAETAAIIALGVLEGRWKRIKARSGFGAGAAGDFGDGGGEFSGLPSVGETTSASGEPASGAAGIRVRAEFESLGDWQQIRGRLGAVPGVQAVKVGALSARSADVTIFFPGDANQLQSALESQGLSLAGGGNGLVLRSN